MADGPCRTELSIMVLDNWDVNFFVNLCAYVVNKNPKAEVQINKFISRVRSLERQEEYRLFLESMKPS
jgi:hypothetical protein